MSYLNTAMNKNSARSIVLCTLCIGIVTACGSIRSEKNPAMDLKEHLRKINCEDGGQLVETIRWLGPIEGISCGGEATPLSKFTYVSFGFRSGVVLTLYTKPLERRLCGSIKKGNLNMLDSVVVTRVTFGRSDGDRRYDVDTIVERRAGR